MRIVSAVVLAAALAAPAAAEQINRIVLRVNDRIVTLGEYQERRQARLEAIAQSKELEQEHRSSLTADAGKATLRELFEEALVLSRAQQLRLVAEPAEVDRAIDSARRRFGIETDADFAAALDQSGSSIEEFRAHMARQILLNEVAQQEVSPKVKVDDEEVARYWRDHAAEFTKPERRRIGEAVVRDDAARPAAERRELAVRIRDAVVGGEAIEAVVARLGVADQVLVLDHGWIEHGELEARLDTAVWELAAGGVAGPLEGRGGFHVVHLREVEPSAVRPLEEVREAILGKLRDEQYLERSQELLERLERSAFIIENVPAEAVGYRTTKIDENDPVRVLMRGAPPAIEPEEPVEEPVAPPGAAAQTERKNA
ncbi:MAG TPA: peptidyl-prolyl cis-trans isomerase [Thermoanaerobaculia bacterium]|nr:peptidyl-prolyl cis-trans isomerase [Thermoanaerobaculia bacterium]